MSCATESKVQGVAVVQNTQGDQYGYKRCFEYQVSSFFTAQHRTKEPRRERRGFPKLDVQQTV